jgi:hypothetical protein
MKQLKWTPLTPYAILKSGNWFSGRVMAILTYGETVIVATQFGGVWVIDTDKTILEGYTSSCLTDAWDDPDVSSLAHGPDDDSQVYAGCENTLYYLELRKGSLGTTMTFSTIINVPVSELNTVYHISVQKEMRRVILATGSGVWWSNIPSNPQVATGYSFQKATGLPGDKVAGLCLASDLTLHASVWGKGDPSSDEFGIFKGAFQNNQLVFTRSKIQWNNGLDKHNMTRVSLASCATDRSAAFGVSSGQDDNFMGVLTYDEGKDQWNDILNKIDFSSATSDPSPGGQGGFNNCIAVAPDESDLVAFGWQEGTYVLSSGKVKMLDDPKTHHDMHGLHFTKKENGLHTLYVGGDGGILKVTGPAQKHPTFGDRLNVFLPTLLFKDDLRRAYATMDVSPVTDGLISGGLQDNGVKYLKTSPSKYEYWNQIIGADGGTNTFLANGILLSRESNEGNPFRGSIWNYASNAFNASFAIPNDVTVKDDPRMEICTRISAPTFRNRKNQLMHAVSAAVLDGTSNSIPDGSNIVLGLFADDESNTSFHWEVIGTTPDLITAAVSFDGNYVFVATQATKTDVGKISLLNVSKFLKKQNDFLSPMFLPSSLPAGSILQFEIQAPNLIFALYTADSQGYILVYDGMVWNNIPTPVSEVIYSIAVDWADDTSFWNQEENTLFFVTDNAVYQGVQNNSSRIIASTGNVFQSVQNNVLGLQFSGFQTSFTWENSSDGLPARPHGSHLRIGWDGDKKFLYLSTYGRSVYRAQIGQAVKMPGQGEISEVQVVFGVIQDGGGGVLDPKTGKIIIVPPRQPVELVLRSFLINEMARGTKTPETISLQRTALNGIQKYLEEETKSIK